LACDSRGRSHAPFRNRIVTEADFIIVAIAIAVVGIIIMIVALSDPARAARAWKSEASRRARRLAPKGRANSSS
jgi:threonine/homoserine/homoserine lactone efflux protein